MKATQYRNHVAKALQSLALSIGTRGEGKRTHYLAALAELNKAQVYFTQTRKESTK